MKAYIDTQNDSTVLTSVILVHNIIGVGAQYCKLEARSVSWEQWQTQTASTILFN